MSSQPQRARQANLLATVALGLADRLGDLAADGVQLDATAATALVGLLDFTPHGSVRALSRVIGLTHSGTVRLVTRLVSAGLAERGDAADARATTVSLTDHGHTVALGLRRRRAEVIEGALDGQTPAQRAELERVCESIVTNLVGQRLAQRRTGQDPPGGALCRLCDFVACGRPEGQCPAATAAVARPAATTEG